MPLLVLLIQELQAASHPKPLDLARVLRLHLDEAVHVIRVYGAVGVVDLRARQALARDAAGERLLQVGGADDLGHVVVGTVHLRSWDGLRDTKADLAFNFYSRATAKYLF